MFSLSFHYAHVAEAGLWLSARRMLITAFVTGPSTDCPYPRNRGSCLRPLSSSQPLPATCLWRNQIRSSMIDNGRVGGAPLAETRGKCKRRGEVRCLPVELLSQLKTRSDRQGQAQRPWVQAATAWFWVLAWETEKIMEAKVIRFLYSRKCKEIRAQLAEQLKCLDQQCELRVQLLQDLQDFFRKKAEIEMDYSRNLEKLAERFLAKTRSAKDHQFKKEQNVLSPVNCWNLLLAQVKRESRDHATLSDLYLNNIIPRFAQISEDSGRLFKKGRVNISYEAIHLMTLHHSKVALAYTLGLKLSEQARLSTPVTSPVLKGGEGRSGEERRAVIRLLRSGREWDCGF
ncbi:hypothetical protein P4O66_000457 [Electrophorus voltai]|uniref:F-BAR domain-containing protein n=1 Tax=Electrophorus voltai TaxID=2609070 RepID=A0AAD9E079_9TELE|nr:hypothetical protein P4O66_000457 [Electrophorus voltai]